MKTKYVMAGCKSTQHGRFNTREDIEALLLALSDIVLDVGSDQKRSPRILPNGKVDTNDATVEQYQKYANAGGQLKYANAVPPPLIQVLVLVISTPMR